MELWVATFAKLFIVSCFIVCAIFGAVGVLGAIVSILSNRRRK